MSHHDHPVWRLWAASGEPRPFETDGTAIVPLASQSGVCAVTGGPGAYLFEQAFSPNFTQPRYASPVFRYGARSSGRSRPSNQPQYVLSEAAVWAAKWLGWRCATWICEPQPDGSDKLHFHPYFRVAKDAEKAMAWRKGWGKTDPAQWLSWLLQPRPVGTIAGMPLFGIRHGGEQNWGRIVRPGSVPAKPLIKLQAKHVAVFAQASTRHGVLCLQVDSEQVVSVDTARWRPAHEAVLALVRRLQELKVPGPAIGRAIEARSLEREASSAAHAALQTTLGSLGDLPRHPFWPLFCGGIHV